MNEQLELDFCAPPTPRPRTTHLPGCPRCEGQPGENGLCWDHQLDDIHARERLEPRLSREEWEQHRGIIETMKRDLLAAAAAGRPMPWRESEDMTPRERLDFRHRVFVAMMETGTVIVTAPIDEPKKKRR